jgi:hypothetical protein
MSVILDSIVKNWLSITDSVDWRSKKKIRASQTGFCSRRRRFFDWMKCIK